MTNGHSTLRAKKVIVYIAYARDDAKDTSLVKVLVSKHLYPLSQSGIAQFYYEVPLGENIEELPKERLKLADIILLMISPESMSSDYFLDTEIRLAKDRYNDGSATVIPILLRPYSW